MNIKKTAILVFMLLFSCTPISYLPKPNDVPSTPFGCHIKVKTRDNKTTIGELIAVAEDSLIVSQNFPYDTMVVNINDIKRYVLQFANGERLWWSIPVLSLCLPLFPVPNLASYGGIPMHGYYSVYSVPTNLIFTSLITGAAYNEYKLQKIDFHKELPMYARFPQGLPGNSGNGLSAEENFPYIRITMPDDTSNVDTIPIPEALDPDAPSLQSDTVTTPDARPSP